MSNVVLLICKLSLVLCFQDQMHFVINLVSDCVKYVDVYEFVNEYIHNDKRFAYVNFYNEHGLMRTAGMVLVMFCHSDF